VRLINNGWVIGVAVGSLCLVVGWLMNAWGAWDHVPPPHHLTFGLLPPPIIVQVGSLINLCHN
jgi:hypothetical protein